MCRVWTDVTDLNVRHTLKAFEMPRDNNGSRYIKQQFYLDKMRLLSNVSSPNGDIGLRLLSRSWDLEFCCNVVNRIWGSHIGEYEDGAYDRSRKHLWNVGQLLRDYEALQPNRQPSSVSYLPSELQRGLSVTSRNILLTKGKTGEVGRTCATPNCGSCTRT
jgi:hypothetical protein